MLCCYAVDLGDCGHIRICLDAMALDVRRPQIAVAVVMRQGIGDDVFNLPSLGYTDLAFAEMADAKG